MVAFWVTPPVVVNVIGEPVAVTAAFTVTVAAFTPIGPPEVMAPPRVMAEVLPGEPMLKLLLFAALITPVE